MWTSEVDAVLYLSLCRFRNHMIWDELGGNQNCWCSRCFGRRSKPRILSSDVVLDRGASCNFLWIHLIWSNQVCPKGVLSVGHSTFILDYCILLDLERTVTTFSTQSLQTMASYMLPFDRVTPIVGDLAMNNKIPWHVPVKCKWKVIIKRYLKIETSPKYIFWILNSKKQVFNSCNVELSPNIANPMVPGHVYFTSVPSAPWPLGFRGHWSCLSWKLW